MLYDSRKRIDLHPQQRRVGYLFQNYALFPNMTLRQNILCGLKNQPDKAQRVKEADEMIAMMGLQGLEKHRPYQLSGGQQQRVLLARALCATGKLLLLDEPVTGLDPIMTGELYHIFKDCIEKYGVTVIMVSHDIRGTLGQANRILHLSGGTQQFFGTTEEYLRSPVGQRFAGGGL